MYDDKTLKELKRLNFEDFLWIIFAVLCLINVYGDYEEKEYLKSNNKIFKNKSNYIFELTLIVTFFIYVYFFLRNYSFYKKASNQDKQLYSIKILGSSFLIAGIICLIYFQKEQTSFVGSPAL